MKRIGISQRLDFYADRGERRDALDQRWAEFLWPLGLVAFPLPSLCPNTVSYITALKLDGFILSGGNNLGEVPERDALECAILTYAQMNFLPVIGVCRGMEFMNVFAGGRLRDVTGHVAVTHEITGPMADTYGIKHVNSYHSIGCMLDDIASELSVVAQSNDGLVEAVHHKDLPWLGIMWHPERSSPYTPEDCQVFKDHFGVSNESNHPSSRSRQPIAPLY
jgi:gamma-glutamyl-gamma-aminobutyrate hydrolase PuuD